MTSKLFLFDNGGPMNFYIAGTTNGDLALRDTILGHGGRLSSPFHADFALVDPEDGVNDEMLQLPAPLVAKSWIIQSHSNGGILPAYPYLCDLHQGPQDSGPANLWVAARDLAELIKEVLELKGAVSYGRIFGTLHTKYPHHTSKQWESLYRENKTKIDRAISIIEADRTQELDESIVSVLSNTANTQAPSSVPPDEDTVIDDADTLFSAESDEPMPYTTDHKTGPQERAARTPQGYDEEEEGSTSLASDDSSADPDFNWPCHPRKGRKRNYRVSKNTGALLSRYTVAELDAMVDFLVTQTRKGLAGSSENRSFWARFRNEDPSRNRRTAQAWRRYYQRHRPDLDARVKAVLSAKEESREEIDESHYVKEQRQSQQRGVVVEGEAAAGPDMVNVNEGRFFNRYTDSEVDDMVEFIAHQAKQGLADEPRGLAFWKVFWSQHPIRQHRKPDAWEGHYARHRADLDARVQTILDTKMDQQKQEAKIDQPDGISPQPSNSDEYGLLPAGWQRFWSKENEGMPFYHHAVDDISTWDRPTW